MTPRARILAFVVGLLGAVGAFAVEAGTRVVSLQLFREPLATEHAPPRVGDEIGIRLALSGDIASGVPVRMWVNGLLSATTIINAYNIDRFWHLISLGAGTNVVYADVAADDQFAAASSLPLSVTLERGTPEFAGGLGLPGQPDGRPYRQDFLLRECVGQQVQLTAVGQLPRPTGTITVYLAGQANASSLGIPQDTGYQCADFPTSGDTVPRGPVPVDAAYSGDANWAAVPRRIVGSVTDRANATIDIQRSVTRPVSGQPVTFTVKMVPAPSVSGVPDGEVIVQIGAERRHLPLDASGSATTQATFRAQGEGSSSGVAVYYPDRPRWYFVGTAQGLPAQYIFPVDQASVRLQLAAPQGPIYTGAPVKLRALVSPVAPSVDAPTGYVSFIKGSNGTGPADCYSSIVDGIADCTLTFSSPGIASVTLAYVFGDRFVPAAYLPATLVASVNVNAPSLQGAHLGLSQTTMDFGAVAVGGASVHRSVELTNAGDVAVALTAYASPGFNVNSQCPSSLAPGDRCTIDVGFAPASEGAQSGVLTIASNASESPQAVPLSGIGSGTANFSGTWWNAPGGSESGWGINFAHQGDTIFATWFTHDASGRAWQMSMTFTQNGPNTFAGTIYNTTGPSLDASPFDPTLVQRIPVGFGTLAFSDATHGTFAYTVNGISQTKSITPLVFGTLPTCTWGALANLAQAINYQDTWWASPAGSESGWGINFTHQGDTLFATWFTFDFSGAAIQMSGTLTKISQGVYQGALIRTSGPPFSAMPFDPNLVMRTTVGTATVTFANGNAGTFNYSVTMDGKSTTQTKAITRLIFRSPGTACN